MATERLGRAVLEIATDSAGFKRGLSDIKSEAGGLQPVFSKIGGLLAAAFSTTAIIAFGKEMLSFSSDMADLSLETGIGTTKLQAWNLVLATAGLKVEDLSRGVGQLAKRLIGDDKSAVRAVEFLGLNLQEIVDANPGDAFIAITEAVSKLPNVSDRMAIMKELFGREGTKFLRVATGDLKDLIDTAEKSPGIIKPEAIARLDTFGDEMGTLWTTAKGVVTTIGVELIDALGKVNMNESVVLSTQELARQSQALAVSQQAVAQGNTAATATVVPLTQSYRDYIKEQEASEKKAKEEEKAEKEKAKAREEHNKKVAEAAKAYRLLIAESINLAGVAEQEAYALAFTKSITSQQTKALQELTMQGATYGGQQLKLIENESDLAAGLIYSTGEIKQNTVAMEGQVGQMIVAREKSIAWQNQMHELGQSFVDFAAVAGDAMGATLRSIGSMIVGVELAQKGTKSLTDGFKALGSGSILQGLTGIVGGIGGIVAAASAAISAIKALWNAFRSEESVKVNSPRDNFFDQYGGYNGLAEKLTAASDGNIAEQLIRTLYDADTESKFHSAEDAIIDLIGGQRFAKGGIVMKPLIGMVGERGPEAIIPLDRLPSMNERPIEVTIQLDGLTLAKAVQRHWPRALSHAGLA